MKALKVVAAVAAVVCVVSKAASGDLYVAVGGEGDGSSGES